MSFTKVTTSWDDGHVLDMKVAMLLKKYSLKGTFYISPKDNEFSEKRLLTVSQIKKLSSEFEIGAHTMTHPHLTKIPTKVAASEIKSSKIYLERIIGKKVRSFCYPYGEFNIEVKKMVEKQGFVISRTTKRFVLSNGRDPFALPTTVQAYNHLTDVGNILVFAKFNPVKFLTYMQWENLAKDLFLQCLKQKGIFHLWGHSWEIDKYNGWESLENVFRFISERKNVSHVTNFGIL